jgi:uncharacterized protein (TIGR01777 family)
MEVLVAGASGLIGTELCSQLEAAGHTPLRLVRGEPRASTEYRWDPAGLGVDVDLIDRVDAIVNLSGASLARLPWTPGYRRTILHSRVQATRTLTDAMSRAATPPRILLSASAVGYYGDRPGEELTETSPPGEGFLARVVERWEHEASLAPTLTRVVTMRTGLVLARGGALRPLLPLARLGLSGSLGSGTQHWPWISLYDEAAAMVHLLTSSLSGPVNLVGPLPATANEVLKGLADSLRRPYRLRVPERILKLALQDAGQDLLLADQRVSSAKLQSDGFEFAHRTAREAIIWMLAHK